MDGMTGIVEFDDLAIVKLGDITFVVAKSFDVADNVMLRRGEYAELLAGVGNKCIFVVSEVVKLSALQESVEFKALVAAEIQKALGKVD